MSKNAGNSLSHTASKTPQSFVTLLATEEKLTLAALQHPGNFGLKAALRCAVNERQQSGDTVEKLRSLGIPFEFVEPVPVDVFE